MAEELTVLQIVQGVEKLYTEFTDSIRSMGSKNGKKGKSRMGASVLHWIVGSHVKTERDLLCDKFLQDVQGQLQNLDYALEGIPEEEAQEACGILADVMSEPVPAKSNSTTDLMKRAMISQLKPYLPRLSAEKLAQVKTRLETAYSKSQRLPVERETLKEIDRLLT